MKTEFDLVITSFHTIFIKLLAVLNKLVFTPPENDFSYYWLISD